MTSSTPQLEFSFPVEIVSLPTTGRAYRVSASPEERVRVAERLGVRSVESLNGTFELKPFAGGVRAVGEVSADVVQACVVSLVPVPASLKETVDVRFVATTPKPKKYDDEEDEEEVVALEAEDPPEVAENGWIDLGELVVAQIALALDPYPRAPGAAFKSVSTSGLEPGPVTESPFAVLRKLKSPPAS